VNLKFDELHVLRGVKVRGAPTMRPCVRQCLKAQLVVYQSEAWVARAQKWLPREYGLYGLEKNKHK